MPRGEGTQSKLSDNPTSLGTLPYALSNVSFGVDIQPPLKIWYDREASNLQRRND